ncbi:DUF3556 domain-containing protein [[Mycobacterium] vasticus]|uniref:DUF3556 domain-containing protein n=1 Tax=[Mycobacterium] vasticus TaxID=2875777 RepID=A0ABU5YTS0_9MYCO|nr:DUF3556 domain-containing protein [Mycolicibacter sp. MYC017]MEB3068508.1 DUF3556 domain-containing protein [Mycolicibacter sp. MYC017]
MGFIKPSVPDVDPETWRAAGWATRIQIVSRHWAEQGFGTPSGVYLIYLLKIAAYVAGATAVIAATPGLDGLSRISEWWTQPIVYQKLVVFSLLFEILGLGCGSGPLTARFWPPIGGVLYWLRPNTIRLPPWPDKVPLTRGDTRTVIDVALYAAVLICGVRLLLSAGQGDPGPVGLLDPKLVVPVVITLVVLGLRDKTIFLAARAEHYGLTLLVFFFPYVDQLAAFKLIILGLWWGAATSKLNHHFPYVVAVMTSNNALLRAKIFTGLKRRMYVDHLDDLRPTRIPQLMAHVGGTTAEFVVPALLVLVAGDHPWRWFLIAFMVIFHLNILSNLPMGVPLEWNVFFLFSLFFLFGQHPEVSVYDLRSPLLMAILLTGLVVIPIAGNMFPQQISFLPAMRYYAGNWAASFWCFRAGAEDALETKIVKSSPLVINQLAKFYDPATVDLVAAKVPGAFRAMHLHGRALNGLLPRALGGEGNAADYTIRDGEVIAGPLIGWNFGEGHLHNEQLLAAVQRRCDFADGDLRVITLEGQPIHRREQAYQIFDAKTGLIEAGYVAIADMLSRQPWPQPGDELPVRITKRGRVKPDR